MFRNKARCIDLDVGIQRGFIRSLETRYSGRGTPLSLLICPFLVALHTDRQGTFHRDFRKAGNQLPRKLSIRPPAGGRVEDDRDAVRRQAGAGERERPVEQIAFFRAIGGLRRQDVPDLIGFQHFNRRSDLSEFRQQMRDDRALPRSGQARNPDRECGLI